LAKRLPSPSPKKVVTILLYITIAPVKIFEINCLRPSKRLRGVLTFDLLSFKRILETMRASANFIETLFTKLEMQMFSSTMLEQTEAITPSTL
jgi:hypothetical protein